MKWKDVFKNKSTDVDEIRKILSDIATKKDNFEDGVVLCYLKLTELSSLTNEFDGIDVAILNELKVSIANSTSLAGLDYIGIQTYKSDYPEKFQKLVLSIIKKLYSISDIGSNVKIKGNVYSSSIFSGNNNTIG